MIKQAKTYMADQETNTPIRLDKWLWAARFFKTRSLAAEAITGGKISINGDRAKPSRLVQCGDRLAIRRSPYEWVVIVKNVSRLRGPASQAQQLYEETEASARKREAAIAQLRLERPQKFDSAGRPSKKDRRASARWTRHGW
jgi:ribosome-associated heat shock protein Hsp15